MDAARALIVATFAVTFVGRVAAQQLDTAAVERALRDEQRAYAAPGVAIAIVIGDSVVFQRAFGATSVETGTPVTPGTLFRLGSTTKMFTGLTALLLSQEQRLDLDRPISRYAHGLNRSIGKLTLRQLLSHSAGLINEGAADGPHDDDALGRRVRSWTQRYSFAPAGDIYSYSSPGYWLAGYVLEESAKSHYADVVRKTVLAPLGMTRSGFRPLEAMTFPLALDHRVTNGTASVLRPFTDDATTWASGSLFSSVEELSRFAIAMLNDGRIAGRQLLSPAAVRAMYEPQVPVPGRDCAYTFGLSMCPRGDARRYNHYGFRLGSGSVVTLIPAKRIGIIILSNRNGGIFARTEAKVLELLAPDSTQPGSTPPPRPLKPVERRAMEGLWVNGSDSLRFSQQRDSLFFSYNGGPRLPATGGRPDEIVILDAGRPVQTFLRTTGKSGRQYLHDGLSAFSARKR